MSQTVQPPSGQKFAMWLVRSPFGLRLSAKGREKAANKVLDGATKETIHIPRSDGNGNITARVYKPTARKEPLPVVVFFHGGGYATGWPERHHLLFERMMNARPCIIVAPLFRLSIDAPYPAGHDDCYDVFDWVQCNMETLGGKPGALVLAGNSSGGGLVLSTSLRARDEGNSSVAFQVALYPMIDDRPNQWEELPDNQVTWNKRNGLLAWHLLLKGLRGQKKIRIPAYAAPARADDLGGLPPLLSYVGDKDILVTEATRFAERMKEAGGAVTFRVFENMFHAMEASVPAAIASIRANEWFSREFGRMIDEYC